MRASGLWPMLERARAANLAEAGEAPPVAGAEGGTRRAVLKALAAAAIVPALPEPAAKGPGPVAIVGGGIAGLSALWHLTRAGIDAHLWEARTRLGGRMYTAKVPGAEPSETGGQLVNTEHHDMFDLCRTFGVGLIDRKAGRFRTLVMDGPALVAEADAVAALRPLAAQMTKDADRLDRDYAGVAAELDALSFTGYLDKHRSTLTEPWIRRLMEQTARTEYGVEPGEASAVELMFNLPSVEGARVDVLSRSDERWLVAGGSSALVEAMAARMTRRISTGKKVAAINTGPQGARLVFADGSHVDAGAVIVATPASVTRKIAFGVTLPPLWKRFLLEVGLGHNEKVQATMASRPWETVVGRGGEVWSAGTAPVIGQGWDGAVRPHAGAAAAGGLWTWFLGGAQVARAADGNALAEARDYARSVEAGVPGMGAATTGARRTGWHLDPMAMGAYVNFKPGQMTRFARLIWVEEHGRASPPLASGLVHFAGEHLSDAYPGYMNGGAQTGRLAAEAAIAQMSRAKAA